MLLNDFALVNIPLYSNIKFTPTGASHATANLIELLLWTLPHINIQSFKSRDKKFNLEYGIIYRLIGYMYITCARTFRLCQLGVENIRHNIFSVCILIFEHILQNYSQIIVIRNKRTFPIVHIYCSSTQELLLNEWSATYKHIREDKPIRIVYEILHWKYRNLINDPET